VTISPDEETRTFGVQQFLLSRRARPTTTAGVAIERYAYSLEHIGSRGHEWLGSFAEPEGAWALALRHARALDISGYCDGDILVRIARSGGKIHQARIDTSITACGLEFSGSALRYRVPGDGRDSKQITCDCCVPRGIPMRWRAPQPRKPDADQKMGQSQMSDQD
jgi:hypothetical protein